MKLLPAFVLLIVLAGAVRAQDTVLQRIGAQFSYHSYDFFTGVHYAREKDYFEHRFMLQTGVMRTFFQSRLYPQIGYRFSWKALHVRTFRVGLFVQPMVSLLNVNRSAQHGTSFWEEAFAGAFFSMGKRSRFQLSGGMGPCIEQTWSALDGRYQNYFSWNYIAEISWSYAF